MNEAAIQIQLLSQQIKTAPNITQMRKINRDINLASKLIVAMKEGTEENVKIIAPLGTSCYATGRVLAERQHNMKNGVQNKPQDIPQLRTRFFEFDGVQFPIPPSGVYSADEACKLIRNNNINVNKLIKHFIVEKYIPIKKTQMYDILKQFDLKIPVTWRKRGRVPIQSNIELLEIVKKHKEDECKSLKTKDMGKYLQEQMVITAQ